jgi:predicted AlkP superfamily pyrophosphatase or phosphodiesterase
LKGTTDVKKVILVLCDALGYDTAIAGMGFLGHLVETKQASLYKVMGELPSMSRPIYETIHTGLPVSEHGILANYIVRRSDKPNIFQICVDAGRTTAAAAYYWFSELYNRTPYDRLEDREVDDENLLIQHGRFYTEDDYPDIELFQSAGTLVRRFQPDYLLVHPMGMDYQGEKFGADSSQYRNQAIYQDMYMSALIAEWSGLGYNILVTGDHGMNPDGLHGGTTLDVREVPLYIIQPGKPAAGDTGETVSQLQVAPTLCHLLGVPIPDSMTQAPII